MAGPLLIAGTTRVSFVGGRPEPVGMTRWHPWRYLRDHHPHVHVDCTHALPAPSLGEWDGVDTIRLHRELGQAERRSTLTHEIGHVERGAVPPEPRARAREERAVDAWAARRLIPLELLIDAARWGQGRADHDDLWVDPAMLQVRVLTLTDDERTAIEEALGD